MEELDILNKLNLESNKYILLSAHREENIDIEDNRNTAPDFAGAGGGSAADGIVCAGAL